MIRAAGVAVVACALAHAAAASPCPALAGWQPVATAHAPGPSAHLATAWDGTRLFVFGDHGAGIFEPCANRWFRATTRGMPPQLLSPNLLGRSVFDDHTPLVVGPRVVWMLEADDRAGVPHAPHLAGAIYQVPEDRWIPIPLGGALPVPRTTPALATDGARLFVWGGRADLADSRGSVQLQPVATGAIIDVGTGRARAMATAGAPAASVAPGAVWTGTRLFVFGGTAALYDPAADRWSSVSTTGAPLARDGALVGWTGSRVVIYGRRAPDVWDGGVYDPATDRWTPIPDPSPVTRNAPGVPVLLGHLLVHRGAAVLAVYDVDDPSAGWRALPARPSHNLDGDVLRQAPGIVDASLAARALATLDPAAGRWRQAALPPGAPARPQVVLWTGDRLVTWGSLTYEPVPGAKRREFRCPPRMGCDPPYGATPVRAVPHAGGVMITPRLAP